MGWGGVGSVDENGVGWCGVVGGWNGWGVWMRME